MNFYEKFGLFLLFMTVIANQNGLPPLVLFITGFCGMALFFFGD